jgi:hypothetical protein
LLYARGRDAVIGANHILKYETIKASVMEAQLASVADMLFDALRKRFAARRPPFIYIFIVKSPVEQYQLRRRVLSVVVRT